MHAKLLRIREIATSGRRAFALVWSADPGSTRALAALTVIGASLPAAQAWAAKLIMDAVLAARGIPGASLWAAAPYLALELALLLVSSVCAQLRDLVEESMDHRLGHTINTSIIRKALGLELRWFEDAEFYDKMQTARRQSEFRALGLVVAAFMLAQSALALLSFLVILWRFNGWVAAVLFGATLPAFLARTRYSNLKFRLQSWRAPEARQMQYYEQLLTQDTAAKEVKLFGLGETLLSRYDAIFQKTFAEDLALARRRSVASVGWGLVSSLSAYAAYGWIIWRAIVAEITVGEMTLYLALFRSSLGTFQAVFESLARLHENGLFLTHYFSFLDLPSRETGTVKASAQRTAPGAQGVEFRNVSFRYSNGVGALNDFSLKVGPREKIALVGENGAGKTTLIKLLSRLYEPTEGVILLNGRDLREYDLAELRSRIGVIFQDFVRYQLALKENVAFGDAFVTGASAAERIRVAAEKGGAAQVAKELPSGMDTVLGSWFKEGRELSGGQWQKVALSRAFMREGEVLVLDEPTSALDAEQEYRVFQLFRELAKDRIAFLISHRFSTVRMADRIVVMKNGRLSELGSHDELLAAGGTYSRLFKLQAEGYR